MVGHKAFKEFKNTNSAGCLRNIFISIIISSLVFIKNGPESNILKGRLFGGEFRSQKVLARIKVPHSDYSKN